MRPKMINGKGLTGEMLLNLAQCYVESINKGGVPEILTSLERVINNESKKIYESTVKEYMKLVSYGVWHGVWCGMIQVSIELVN